MSNPNPLQDAEKAALAAVNKEKSTASAWANSHKGWLIAIAIAAAIAFIVGHLV